MTSPSEEKMPKLGNDEETETFAWLLPFRHRGVVAYGGRRLDPVIHRSGQAWLSNGLHGSLLAWEQVSGGTVNSNRHGSMEAQFIRKKKTEIDMEKDRQTQTDRQTDR